MTLDTILLVVTVGGAALILTLSIRDIVKFHRRPRPTLAGAHSYAAEVVYSRDGAPRFSIAGSLDPKAAKRRAKLRLAKQDASRQAQRANRSRRAR